MTNKGRKSHKQVPSNNLNVFSHGNLATGLVVFTHITVLFLIYSQTYGFDYVYFDDYEYVLGNSIVSSGLSLDGVRWAFTSFYGSNWHPVTWISHMADVSLFGTNPGWAHIHNVALHGVNSLLVYLILLKFSESRWKACILSLVFLAHPLHVESVAWIAERKDLLCAFFFLLGLLLYDSYRARPSRIVYTLLFLTYTLALMAKPMAVSFPFVLLILDFFIYRQHFLSKCDSSQHSKFHCFGAIQEKLPLLALSAASSVVTIMAQASGRSIATLEHHSMIARLETAITAYAIYLKQFLFPVDLAVFYPISKPESGLFVLALAGFFVATLLTLSRKIIARPPIVAAGLYFYLITLIPVIGLLQVGEQAHADRYMYLPSIGILMMCIPLMPSRERKYFQLGRVISVVVILYFSLLCYWQVTYWANRHSLFSRVLDVTGPNYRAYVHLGGYYLNRGMQAHAQKQAIAAAHLKPNSSVAYKLMGDIALSEKNYSAAEKLYYLSLDKGDHSAELQNNLGISLAEQGRIREGVAAFEKAANMEPTFAEPRQNLVLYRKKARNEISNEP